MAAFWNRFFNREESSVEETAENAYTSIGQFDGHDVGIAGNVTGSPESARAYEDYYAHQGEYHTNRYEESCLSFVNPKEIEGVYVRGLPDENSSESFSVENPETFWTMRNGENHERYLELTSRIPEINDRLAGKSAEEQEQIIQSLQDDEVLGDCARECFSPGKRVAVWELDDIYELDRNGRHRVLAARENMEAARQEAMENGMPFDESRYALPVQVVGSLERENAESLAEDAHPEEYETEALNMAPAAAPEEYETEAMDMAPAAAPEEYEAEAMDMAPAAAPEEYEAEAMNMAPAPAPEKHEAETMDMAPAVAPEKHETEAMDMAPTAAPEKHETEAMDMAPAAAPEESAAQEQAMSM